VTYDVHCVSKVSSLGGSFPTVRATAVRRDVVLAGDPKCLVYYVISKLNKTYLAGDPKRKGYGCTCWYRLIYRVVDSAAKVRFSPVL